MKSLPAIGVVLGLCLAAALSSSAVAQKPDPGEAKPQVAGSASLAEQIERFNVRHKASLVSGQDPSAVATARKRIETVIGELSSEQLASENAQILSWARTLLRLQDPPACRALVTRLEAAFAVAPDVPVDRRQLASFWFAKSLCDERRFQDALPRLVAVDDYWCRATDEGDATRLFIRKLRVDALQATGQTREALALQKQVMDVHHSLRAKHPARSVDAERLLGVLCHYTGDRQGAFDAFGRYHEAVVELMPDDVTKLTDARQTLASAMSMLHDHRGALELLRKVVATNSERLPPTDPGLLTNRISVAKLVGQVGSKAEMGALLDGIWPDLQVTKSGPTRDRLVSDWHRSRAMAYHGERDFAQVRTHMSKALEWLAKNRRKDDRDLNQCRIVLGGVQIKSGKFATAIETLEQVLLDLGQRYPMDHGFMRTAVAELVTAHRLEESWDRAVELCTSMFDSTLLALNESVQASRPAGALAKRQKATLGRAVDLLLDDLPTERRRAVAGMALLTSQLRLGMETRVARSASQARRNRRGKAREVGDKLRSIVARIQVVSRGSVDGVAGGAKLSELVRAREKLERELVQLSRAEGTPELPALAQLAAALPPRSVAVAIAHVGRTIDVGQGLGTYGWLVGLVLRPSGETELVELGRAQGLYELAAAEDAKSRVELRRAVMDPVLAAAGGDVERVVLAVDRQLQLVPLDALPTDQGEPLGATVRLERVGSLLDLLIATPGLPANAQLVAVGGVDYDDGVDADHSFPLAAVAAPTLRKRSSEERAYAPLPGTTREVERLVRSFGVAFPAGAAQKLVGAAATKNALLRGVPGASIVHMATHGFCAPEASAGSALDPQASAVALTPFAYCGLAMAGANRPAAEDGSLPGVLTGEELKQFDLFDAYLVVLSACDSARGLESNLSHASLHAALHGAGARFIISSRWKVGDRAAEQIMAEFYEQLWQRPADPHGALWAAKMKVRLAGVPFRDWAGFLMTGV